MLMEIIMKVMWSCCRRPHIILIPCSPQMELGIQNFILEGVELCISQPMNEDVEREFSYEEVCLALKSMNPLKASGEDGLDAVFYQRF